MIPLAENIQEMQKKIMDEKPADGLLAKLKEYDPPTFTHSLDTAAIALMLCIENGIAYRETAPTVRAAGYHDIGKIGVPAYVLRKEGPLTDHEFLLIAPHSEIGFEILKGIGFYEEALIQITHHEMSKTRPYPRRGTNRQRNNRWAELGQIVAVSDYYSALVEDRPYKTAVTDTDSIGEKLFDGLDCDENLMKQVLRYHHERMRKGLNTS